MDQVYPVNVATNPNIWNSSLLAFTWPQRGMNRGISAGANGDKQQVIFVYWTGEPQHLAFHSRAPNSGHLFGRLIEHQSPLDKGH